MPIKFEPNYLISAKIAKEEYYARNLGAYYEVGGLITIIWGGQKLILLNGSNILWKAWQLPVRILSSICWQVKLPVDQNKINCGVSWAPEKERC